MLNPSLTVSTRTIRLTVDKNAVVIERLDGTAVKDRDKFNKDSKRARRTISRAFGIDENTLLDWVVETGKGTEAKVFDISPPENAVGDVIVRRITERDDQGERYPLDPIHVLTNILPGVDTDHVLTWSDDSRLCCLDIDYHETPAPHESWLLARVASDVAPRPYARHVTRRGGLHMFYIATQDFTAVELAAAAALSWRRVDPVSGIELKTVVRGAGDKRVDYCAGGVQDTTALLAGWIERTSADDTARDEWLESEGMEIAGRYDHTKCPIYPTPNHASEGLPVTINEAGVFCHNCEGKGYSMGCRRPGFAPFAVITGGSGSGDIGLMIKKMCHWGHAKFVLTRKYGFPEAIARKAYAAALKAYHHGTREALLLPLVFHADTEHMTRLHDDWYNMESCLPWNEKGLQSVISVLPCVNSLDDKDQAKARASTVCVLSQPHRHVDRGYPEIDTIHGYSLTKQHMPAHDKPAMIEVIEGGLKYAPGDRAHPRYVPASKRNVKEAWAVIDSIFPKIDQTLIELVITAIGCAQETQLGLNPMLFVSGCSGSAKTTTTKVAAAIIGSTARDFVFAADEARWKQSLYDANHAGGVVLLNELIKDTTRANRGKPIGITQPFDPLLNVTPEASLWVMHRGQKRYGRLSAMVITEPSCPVNLRDEVQISRRIRHWRVDGFKEWSWEKLGMAHVKSLRLVSPVVADACNAIMSDIIDRRFCIPQSWDTIAQDLGCKKIVDSDDFQDMRPMLKEFYRLVCAAPEIANKSLAKRYPNGYKAVSRNAEGQQSGEENPLTAVYSMFADGHGADWLLSRRLDEKDWSGLIKAGSPVWLDMTNDGVNVYVRFRQGPIHKPTKVNSQIVDPSQWEVRT